ncbi:MAG: helix-turn-helix domain-containing protein [Nocardiaceae bacterium]|nr:helix-turn-helix domain-containing protein [Nocardiaceae bacterium]
MSSLQRSAAVLKRSTGRLATAATARMEQDLSWFRDLSAEDRSWVGTIVQAGIGGFVEWYADGHGVPVAPKEREPRADLASSMFGVAPRALTGVISLRQTVDLIRLSIDVVEANLDDLLDPEDSPEVHAAVARYAREVAFASAEVYARAAEARGKWDARLEALVVDAVLRAETDEAVLSRASALGWTARGGLTVVLGAAPARAESDLFDEVRRLANVHDLEALCAVQGDRLVVVLGGVSDARAAAAAVVEAFGEGPVVAGPLADDLATANVSARAALAAYRSAAGWPEAPRPALSEEYLPERVVAGDGHARRHLVDDVYLVLGRTNPTLVETLTAYFAAGGSLEGTARTLFVHPNTVRYRLRQVAELTGLSPSRPRDALALQIALTLGRQSGRDL